MTEPTQTNAPEESEVDLGRRSLLKTLIGGAAGFAFATAVTPAFAKRRRRTGGAPTRTPKPQPQGKSRRRHH